MSLSEPLARDWGAQTTAPGTFVEEHQAGANVTSLDFADGVLTAGLGDGRVVRLQDGEVTEIARHGAAVTALARTDGAMLSSAQDGQLLRLDEAGGCQTLKTTDEWITALVAQGTRSACAAGKAVFVFDGTEAIGRFDAHPSTISGLAFSPEANRLAVSHYNGITIWQLDDLATPMRLNWAGSMIGLSWSPDGRYIAGATQDRELHVWDLAAERDYRLGGYQSKTKQIGWTEDCSHLYSSGADVVVAWGLAGGEPNAMPPVEIGYAFGAVITAVAPRASGDALLAGYSDGSLLLGELTKGTAKILRGGTGAPVTMVRRDGHSGGFGTADGVLGLIET